MNIPTIAIYALAMFAGSFAGNMIGDLTRRSKRQKPKRRFKPCVAEFFNEDGTPVKRPMPFVLDVDDVEIHVPVATETHSVSYIGDECIPDEPQFGSRTYRRVIQFRELKKETEAS